MSGPWPSGKSTVPLPAFTVHISKRKHAAPSRACQWLTLPVLRTGDAMGRLQLLTIRAVAVRVAGTIKTPLLFCHPKAAPFPCRSGCHNFPSALPGVGASARSKPASFSLRLPTETDERYEQRAPSNRARAKTHCKRGHRSAPHPAGACRVHQKLVISRFGLRTGRTIGSAGF